MTLSERLQNKLNIEHSLKAARSYRQELLTKLNAHIQQQDMKPIHALTNGWQEIGDIRRDCSVLEDLIGDQLQDDEVFTAE